MTQNIERSEGVRNPLEMLSAEESMTVDDYDRNATKRNRGPEYWLPEIDEFCLLLSKGHILEIGCGNGVEGEVITNRGFTYVGTDISEGYLAEARRLRPHLDFRHLSAYDMSEFEDALFDGLWAGNVLYHIPKQRIPDVLKEIIRVVRPGGILFISLPIGDSEGMLSKRSFGYESTRYFAHYTSDEATAMFQARGLEVVKLGQKQSCGSETFAIDWLLYFLRVPHRPANE